MEFSNSFAVDVPLERVWALMLDAEQVAPCVPGAQITESIDALHHKGVVKVKLGAVQMTYRGELEMQTDEAARTIVLKARGSESRGGGGASGTFTTKLTPTESGTQVDIHTKVDVTGRVAQFGRGIMQDVANRMIKDFAVCLEHTVSEQRGSDNDAPTASGPSEDSGASNIPESESRSMPATASVPSPPPPRPAPMAPSQSNELRMGKILLDLTRSRVAAGLRLLAKAIEP